MLSAVVIAAAVVVSATNSVYLNRTAAGGTALWNASEAYFFIQVDREGLHVRYLRYPWFIVKENLGDVEDLDDNPASLVVIRVTSSGVEHHVLKLADRARGGAGSDPGLYTALEDNIYANCSQLNGLCRWAGDHFERATEDERRRLDSTKRLTSKDIDNDESGWSRRHFETRPSDDKFTIKVGDEFEIVVNNVAVKRSAHGTLSIDLLRPGRSPERIWDLDLPPEEISRKEYHHIFQNRE